MLPLAFVFTYSLISDHRLLLFDYGALTKDFCYYMTKESYVFINLDIKRADNFNLAGGIWYLQGVGFWFITELAY